MKFNRATKFNSFLKMGIAGMAGSGKTYSALTIATHLSEKRVAVIDAELGSASKYADLFDFDVLELSLDDNGRDVAKPFSPQRYIEAIKAAYESGMYDVLIVDGISPEWDDAGGVLQWVDEMVKRNRAQGEKAATRDAWSVATPIHKDFVNYILRVRMHVICTMRAKKETVADKDASGKVIGKKITLDPIQREDVPYVFDILGIIQSKEMVIDKTRCPQLDDRIFIRPGKEIADIVREWLKGDPLPERPEYLPNTSVQQQPQSLHSVQLADDSPITEQQLASIRKLCEHLKKDAPDMSTMLYLEAKTLIQQLTTEYKEMRATSRPETPQMGQPVVASVPSIKELQAHCRELFGSGQWAAVKVKIIGGNIADDNITPEQQLQLHQAFEKTVAKRAIEQQGMQKAS